VNFGDARDGILGFLTVGVATWFVTELSMLRRLVEKLVTGHEVTKVLTEKNEHRLDKFEEKLDETEDRVDALEWAFKQIK
jgi:hypothetical protein